MSITTRTRWTGRFALAAVVAVAATGCGSSDGGGSSSTAEKASGDVDVAAATKVIAEASAVPAFTLEAPDVNADAVKGKLVFNIPLSSQIPYVAAVDAEIEREVTKRGGKYVAFANDGQPAQWARGIEQAIARKADVIILSQGPDPKVLVPQLRKAKSAGIPVVLSHLYAVGEQPPAEVADLITAYTAVDFAKAAELMADAAIAETKGKVNALVITSNEVAPSKSMQAAIEKRIKERCAECSVTATDVPLTQWGTKLTSETQTALQRDPSINWVLPLYDSMSLNVIAGIKSAGKASGVSVASYNGTPDILKLIADGGPMKVNVGESTSWLGRAAVDQAFRLVAGDEPIADGAVETPLRVFTSANIAEAGTPPVAGKGYGDAYVTGYDALWGSGS